MATKETNRHPDHAALDMLAILDKGRAGIQLTEAQRNVVTAVLAVADPKKKGQVVLKINYYYNSEGQIYVDYDVSATPPKPATGVGFFYANDDFDLVRNDPQGELNLDELNGGK